MGSGKMGYWSIGKIPLDREAIKSISSLFKPTFFPRRRLYPPACKPYGLEAEPEANIPPFPGPDLVSMDSALYLCRAKYYSVNIVFRPSRARAGHYSIWTT